MQIKILFNNKWVRMASAILVVAAAGVAIYVLHWGNRDNTGPVMVLQKGPIEYTSRLTL